MSCHQVLSSEYSVHEVDRLCQHYLAILYHNIQLKSTASKNKISETYGEILYAGVDKILSVIQPSSNDVFVDYGSGLGKMVLQVFLKSSVKKAYGIEILPELHQHAMNAAHRMQHDLPEFYQNERKLTFLQGNFLEIPLTTATIAMVNSTCFTQSLLNQLGALIEKNPSIHTVLSLRPLGRLERLIFKKVFRIECSWDTALCYVYSK